MKTLLIILPGWKRYNGIIIGINNFAHGNHLDIVLHHTAKASREFWEKLFQDYAKEPYFDKRIEYLMSSPSFFFIIEGDRAVQLTNERAAKIREQYDSKKTEEMKNVLRSSKSDGAAIKEVGLFIELLSQNRL